MNLIITEPSLHSLPPLCLAQPHDTEELMQLIRLAHGENGMFPWSERKARAELADTLCKGEGIVGLLKDPSNAIRGLAWLIYCSEWYSETYCLTERLIYVRPDSRNAVYAHALISWVQLMSDRLGAMMVGVVATHRTQAKARMYRRFFGDPVGYYFSYNNYNPEAARLPPLASDAA